MGAKKITFNLKKICIRLETCYLNDNSAGLEFAVGLTPAILMTSLQGLDNLWGLHIDEMNRKVSEGCLRLQL